MRYKQGAQRIGRKFAPNIMGSGKVPGNKYLVNTHCRPVTLLVLGTERGIWQGLLRELTTK
jgi:hypothetical protein